jgi:hypothetical protein
MEAGKIQDPSGCSGNHLLESIIRSLSEKIDPTPQSWCSKYGVNFENETFSIHRYCWCEEENCPWCGPLEAPNFWHKPTGLKVWWYKYIGRGMVFSFTPTIEECALILHDASVVKPSPSPAVS